MRQEQKEPRPHGDERTSNGTAGDVDPDPDQDDDDARVCGSMIVTDDGGDTYAAPRNGASSVEPFPATTFGPVGSKPHRPSQNRVHAHEEPSEPDTSAPALSNLLPEATAAGAVALHDVPTTIAPSAGPLPPRPPAFFSSEDGPPIVMEAHAVPPLWFASSSVTAPRSAAAMMPDPRSGPRQGRSARRRRSGSGAGGTETTNGQNEKMHEGSQQLVTTTTTLLAKMRLLLPPQLAWLLMDGSTWCPWLWSLLLSLVVEAGALLLTDTSAPAIPARISLTPSSMSSLGSRQGGPSQALVLPHQGQQQQPQLAAPMPRGRSVRGLANYGQTCFLNSVLQALASLPSFEVYLHKITALQQLARHGRTLLESGDRTSHSPSASASDGVCQHVLDAIWSINGGCCDQLQGAVNRLDDVQGWARLPAAPTPRFDANRRSDPRPLLRRVGARNAQFAATSSRATTREQQDAQEFWQALLGMVVEDADVPRLGPALSGAAAASHALLNSAAGEGQGEGSERPVTLAAALRLRNTCGDEDDEEEDLGPSASGDCASSCPSLEQTSSYASALPTRFHEEKKFEDGSSGSSSDLELHGDDEKHGNGEAGVGSAYGTSFHAPYQYAAEQPPTGGSGRRMVDAVSSVSPSPFSGWIGSVLQCRECRHVRPIRNHLFVDLPVVPTGVSSYLHRRVQDPRLGQDPSSFSKHRFSDQCPPCTLEQCLEDYTSVERVHDVECRSCTHAREVAMLDDEVRMLEQGIRALEKKNPKSRSDVGADDTRDLARPLRDELQRVRTRLDTLRLTSPDDEGAMERVLSLEQHEQDWDFPDADPPKIQLKRTDAFKCLMLTRLPAVLCIHVQRRFYDPLTLRASKSAQHVIFPEILDLGPFCVYARSSVNGPANDSSAARSSRIPYRLMSVIEHTGGAFYGHYVSYRRDPSDPTGNQWLYISDDTVRRVDWNIVRRCQAYMLFYEALV